jgi:hypothetical protein
MLQPMNNQEFYNRVDETCIRLRDIGMDAEANRIAHRLHEVAWTSTSELFEELVLVFRWVLAGPNAAKLTQQVKNEITEYLELLANV